MKRHPAWSSFRTAALYLPLLLGACATQQQVVASKEHNLSAAGFSARPADTPQREAMLQRLPADRFLKRNVNGRTIYFYGDPLVCGCIYIGSEQAFNKYNQQILAKEEQVTAQDFPDPEFGFTGFGDF